MTTATPVRRPAQWAGRLPMPRAEEAPQQEGVPPWAARAACRGSAAEVAEGRPAAAGESRRQLVAGNHDGDRAGDRVLGIVELAGIAVGGGTVQRRRLGDAGGGRGAGRVHGERVAALAPE